MILTVTPNAALDVTYTVDRIRPDSVHRVGSVRRRAGGKGINVARMLHALGEDVRAVTALGGVVGAAVAHDLVEAGIPAGLASIDGETRCTTTILSAEDGSVTLFNEPGPRFTAADWTLLVDVVRCHAAEVVVCSGSLPPGAPPDGYTRLLGSGKSILDTSGDALLAGLTAEPSVVKPNAAELRDVTGMADPETAAAELRKAGAGAVVVSLGVDGLIAVTGEGTWHAAPSSVLAGNSTGAGDAVVAALALGLRDGEPWPQLLRRAVALSGAAVLGPLAGDVDLAHYHRELAHPKESHAARFRR